MPWSETKPMDERLRLVLEAARGEWFFRALCARYGLPCVLLEGFVPPLCAFLRGRLLDTRRDRPHVTGGVHKPRNPVPPELIR
jgi:hypothetical protein